MAKELVEPYFQNLFEFVPYTPSPGNHLTIKEQIIGFKIHDVSYITLSFETNHGRVSEILEGLKEMDSFKILLFDKQDQL